MGAALLVPALLHALLLAFSAASPQGSLVPASSTSAPRAHVEVTPDHARIGEPIELSIVVEHAAGATVTLPDHATLPRSLAFVQDLGQRRRDDPSAAGRKITRARWSVMALEGGDLAIPPLAVTVEEAGASTTLSADVPKLTVEHALQADEDAPRAARGFRPTPSVHAWSLRGIATAAALLVVAAVAAVVVWKRRGRGKQTVPAPIPPLEMLAQLEARAQAEPASARAVTYELTALVRAAVDAHANAHRSALTDADWSQAISVDASVPETVRASAARLLSAAERVKYAQESPSPLAVREWTGEARRMLEALAGAGRIAA
jgi:hypothetical protein